jgi:hypothetical protein
VHRRGVIYTILRCATQQERYEQGQTLGAMKPGDTTVFLLKEGETPREAANRIRALMGHWKPTMYKRWKSELQEDCVRFTCTGSFESPRPLKYPLKFPVHITKSDSSKSPPKRGFKVQWGEDGLPFVICYTVAEAMELLKEASQYRLGKLELSA